MIKNLTHKLPLERVKEGMRYPVPVWPCLIISLLVLNPAWAGPARRDPPPAQAKVQPGDVRHIGGQWFQYLGTDEGGKALWLYPHREGVSEIFRAGAAAKDVWTGSFETKFDSGSGVFTNLFNAAEVLNDFLSDQNSAADRQSAARLVKLYLALQKEDRPPYYVRAWLDALDKSLKHADLDWVKERAAWHQEMLARAPAPGVRLPALATPTPLEQGPREYYRRMVQDGFLDIAVVSGNMYDEFSGKYQSYEFIEDFCKEMERMGFKSQRVRRSGDKSLYFKQLNMLGQPITVRATITAGSQRDHRILRGVANFVEGLAHADVLIYHGHSNIKTGCYFISENGVEFSRFQIGMKDQRDLKEKCHALKTQPHQLLCFQSCSSYWKYSAPVRKFYDSELAAAPGCAGFAGTADYCWFVDFPPRYAALLDMIFKEKGARDILERINAIRPHAKTPDMLLRGFLQEPYSFCVPKGVRIEKIEDAGEKGYGQVYGTGSDGQRYISTEIFTQNMPGEIVQVVEFPDGVFGLLRDGTLYAAGEGTKGAMTRVPLSKEARGQFVFMAKASERFRKPGLLLTGRDGNLYCSSEGRSEVQPAREQPPQGVRFTAAGDDTRQRLCALDDAGRGWEWDLKLQRFVPLEGKPQFDGFTPSLTNAAAPGELVYGKP